MGGEIKYAVFTTSMGWVGVSGSDKGLLCIALPQRSAQQARHLLGEGLNCAVRSGDCFGVLISRLQTYFDGGKATFPDELDLSRATPFQRRVWEATRLIPYGETRSYAWVAQQVDEPGAARAAGQALARNPLPIIIPCHRVIASDGKLGGFSDGVEMKRRLLRLEASA
ncbi:Methylated-DNA--protein-cysteine methyltransferase [subsurface metagenome]